LPRPVYQIRSPLVEVRPGQYGTVARPVVYILGKRTIGLPSRRFSLDKREQGIGYPLPSLNSGRRLGFGWSGGLLLDDRTAFNFHAAAFPKRFPSGRVTVVRSFLAPEASSAA